VIQISQQPSAWNSIPPFHGCMHLSEYSTENCNPRVQGKWRLSSFIHFSSSECQM